MIFLPNFFIKILYLLNPTPTNNNITPFSLHDNIVKFLYKNIDPINLFCERGCFAF